VIRTLIFSLILLLFACAGDSKNPNESGLEIQESHTDNQASSSIAIEQKIQEKIQRGDTLLAQADSLLACALRIFPMAKIQDINTEFLDFEKGRLLEARVELSLGDNDIRLSLIDYHQQLSTWIELYKLYSTSYILNNESEYASAWNPGKGENFGWVSHLKEDGHMRISLGFSFRYLLSLEVSDVKDTTELYQIVSKAKWEVLTSVVN